MYNLFSPSNCDYNLPQPERQVHAKGVGAHGYFEVTTENGAKLSMANVFSKIGKRTPVTSRFSTIAGNMGSPDAVRDLRGITFKCGATLFDWEASSDIFFKSG